MTKTRELRFRFDGPLGSEGRVQESRFENYEGPTQYRIVGRQPHPKLLRIFENGKVVDYPRRGVELEQWEGGWDLVIRMPR
jgi:hypothetical protein